LSTDTRNISPGSLFIPLQGERFDGHHYLQQALAQGAQAALANTAWWGQQSPEVQQLLTGRVLLVPDTLAAYLALARHHRRRCAASVIALTGSSGKTTTKEMFYAALAPLAPTQKTEKNYNNEVGLCQTLLALQPETRYLVVEMAMRGPGQIRLLTQHGCPDMAIVTNVGPAHIEFLGSLENIARAKCEIFEGLAPNNGLAMVNGDDALLVATAQQQFPQRSFHRYCLEEAQGLAPCPDTGGARFTYQGHPVWLSVWGRHFVSNALAVLRAGQLFGLPIESLAAGLATFSPSAGRGNTVVLPGLPDAVVIEDAYNANPASAQASVTAFLESVASAAPGARRAGGAKPGPRVLVMAGMNELGAFSKAYHEAFGAWLQEAGASGRLTALVTVGEDALHIAAGARGASFTILSVSEAGEVAAKLGPWLVPGVQILLKGSRSYQLERLTQQLEEMLAADVPSLPVS
jgi:UDP-N-acetylmuramoyl-tripeptide--D-alanyl-D-alanine ligase